MKNIFRDLSLIALSILIAYLLANTGAVEKIFSSTSEVQIIGNFIAGMLFTSVFTTAPAIVILGKYTVAQSPWVVAFMGALGALLMDMVIFRFVSTNLYSDFSYLLRHSKLKKLKLLSRLHLKWLLPVIGALIIASPLPDELGLTMLGLSKMKTKYFVPISFIMNFIGILAIGFVANSL